MRVSFGKFFDDHRGSTVIEYAILVALIGVTILASVAQVGTTLSASYLGRLVAAWTPA